MTAKKAATTTKVVKVDGVKVAETRKIDASKPATRADLLQLLDKHGYTGPRSYTAAVLSGVVEWLDAKAPKDQTDGLPDGVVFAVHPDLRPAPAAKARPLGKQYLAALADVLHALDAGEDVREFVTVRLASGEVEA